MIWLLALLALPAQNFRWSPVQMSFVGPLADESTPAPNPFLNLRLTLLLTSPTGKLYEIPGFFDGDGNGGPKGNVWRARWLPDETGTWSYQARFRSGAGIALNTNQNAGSPTGHDVSGTIPVSNPDPAAQGFYRKGMLRHVGQHYYQFDDKSWFLKGGANSPENLLGYAGFDNTFDQPGGASTTGLQAGLHRYSTHVGDWKTGDPMFMSQNTGYNSRGLIGALNYLASRGINSIYFLPMNMGGDGRDTVPFVGYGTSNFDKTHFDVSKLQQWNMVFHHAQELGILLHVVLGETEVGNQQWLDGGQLGTQRKLFYRELVARFAYLPALQWNLSEENPFPVTLLRQFADCIRTFDPYDHPITFHTRPLPSNGAYPDYTAVLGDARFSAASLQAQTVDMGAHIELWRAKSKAAGNKWVVGGDEVAPISAGAGPNNADLLRKRVLYDVYFSGGNIEWFCGGQALPVGGDLTMENFRTRQEMWDYTYNARRLLELLPFVLMDPMDSLVTGENAFEGGAEVFGMPGRVYAIYLPNASPSGSIDLKGVTGTLRKRWYDPRLGAFVGGTQLVQAGGVLPLGTPPNLASEDWVCLFER